MGGETPVEIAEDGIGIPLLPPALGLTTLESLNPVQPDVA